MGNHKKFYVSLTPGCSETEGGKDFWSGTHCLTESEIKSESLGNNFQNRLIYFD